MSNYHVVKEFTPVLDTGIYAAGDVLFTSTVQLQDVCPGVARSTDSSPQALHLQQVIMLDKDDQTAYDINLVFLRSNVSLGTVNDPVSITAANAEEVAGIVLLDGSAQAFDLINSKVYVRHANSLNVIPLATGDSDLYVSAFIAAGTPTHTASGLVFRLVFDVGE